MLARKALRKFMDALIMAPPDARFEVGATWDKTHGWRPYQRIGQHGILLSTDAARKIIAQARKQGANPANQKAFAELQGCFDELETICCDCDAKNMSGELPDTAADFLPPEGTA